MSWFDWALVDLFWATGTAVAWVIRNDLVRPLAAVFCVAAITALLLSTSRID